MNSRTACAGKEKHPGIFSSWQLCNLAEEIGDIPIISWPSSQTTKKKKVKQSPHHFSWMKEKEQRFILSILSKPFNSEELNLILNELISADERRKVENYYRRLLKNPKTCIVFATDGKTWGRQKHIWQNLEKLKTMFIKALLIHCYWFTVLCIPRAGKWSREKKA